MITFGTAWYPEHWPETQWAADLGLMRRAGMNMVRVAEFAWSRLEPAEGQFDLDWLERAVNLAGAYGLTTVLGTPTAAPPAWLTQRYPETLPVRENGRRATHGMRCHYSPTNPIYLQFCRRIVDVMAQRFGHNGHVSGWQIDNEYNSFSYDADTRRQFQVWLQDKFGSLAALAEHWSTAYWSQDYSDWSQIPLPGPNHNPGLWLAFRQFMTHVGVEFQCVQTEAIRKYADRRQFITHNFMKWHDGFDHYQLSEDLDFASWDNYIPNGHLNYLENGAMHDLVRGFKRKNFWVMETQPGQVNWVGVNTTLDVGEVRAMGWHAIGHGSDALVYWQWRSALGGQEQMHGTLLAPDGKPRPVFREIAQLGRELEKIGPYLENTTPSAQVAMLFAYDDRWAIDFQRHHEQFDPVQHLLSYYNPIRAAGHSIDIIHPKSGLSGYKLVIAPTLHLLDSATVDYLLAYVQNGGHLVLGARSGMKDTFNALLPSRQPGLFADALGAHVEEYYALQNPVALGGEFGQGTASIWAEQLQADTPDAHVLLRYGASNGWLDGSPAMITRHFGAGRITYIGAWLSAPLMDKVAAWLLKSSEITTLWAALPAGVEVCHRCRPDQELFILINHTSEPKEISLPQPVTDVLENKAYDQVLHLPARGVALLSTELSLANYQPDTLSQSAV